MLSSNSDSWHCLVCKVKDNHNFPFALCDDIEMQNINNRNSIRYCESLSAFEVVNEVPKFSNQSNNEVDYNLSVRSTCKYYTVNEFQKVNMTNNLNIFHTNINGLEAKFDILHEFVSNDSDLDIKMSLYKGTMNFTLHRIQIKELFM